MPQEYQFVTGPGPPRAPPVPTLEWKKHEETIRGLWKVSTLKELMDIMRVQHAFEPSHKQYVLQLQKWGLHKYTGRPTRRFTTSKKKRPRPSPGSNLPIVIDAPLFQQTRGTKSSKTTAPAPQSSESELEVSPPDREGPGLENPESSEGSRARDSHSDFGEYSGHSSEIQEEEVSDASWMCFCRAHTTNVAGLNAELLKVSMSTSHPSARSDSTASIIERIESAAEYFLYKYLEGDAFQLYVLLLEWALSHKGTFCRCTCDLVHRARVGITLSAFGTSDLEAANKLLDETKGISPPGRSTGPWFLYESIFTWRLYSSRGVLQLHGEREAIRRLKTRVQSTEFSGDPTPYKTLGVMTCYEILSVISGDDAKLHIVNLELGMRHDGEGQAFPESPGQGIHRSDLTSCLKWMLDLPSWRQSGQMLVPLYDIGFDDPYFQYYFSSCWSQLRTQLRVEGRSVALSWFHKPKSTGIRPTELLVVMVDVVMNMNILRHHHLVKDMPVLQRSLPSVVGSIIRDLLSLGESWVLDRFNETRFHYKLVSSLDRLSGHPCTEIRGYVMKRPAERALVVEKRLRVTLTDTPSLTMPSAGGSFPPDR